MSKEDLMEVNGIGESFAEDLVENGVTTPAEFINVDAEPFSRNLGGAFGPERVRQVQQNAKNYLMEQWDDLQYDATHNEYYDAGPSEWFCGCGQVFKREDEWAVHRFNCPLSDKQTVELVLPRDMEIDRERAEEILRRSFSDDGIVVDGSEIDIASVIPESEDGKFNEQDYNRFYQAIRKAEI